MGIVTALATASAPAALAASPGTTAWGGNFYGQLGNGSSTGPSTCMFSEPCSTTPISVSGLSSGVSAVSAGGGHSLALLKNGTVVAWGDNFYGQLGNGSTANSDVPVAVSGLSGVVAVSGGRLHNLALLSDGTVRAWGDNEYGQLGDGSRTSSDVPVAVSGLAGVVGISAGGIHSLAVLSDGTVMAWGANRSGQLGNGASSGPEKCGESFTCSTTPLAVSGLSGVTAVSAGGIHSLALLGDGTVRAWGNNVDGELGNGTTTDSSVPVTVSGLSGVKALSGGGRHSLALLSDGSVRSWGYNGNGALGNGTLVSSNVPVTVTGVSGVSAIAAGEGHSLVRLAGGTAMAWGGNEFGQLGNGTDVNSSAPVAVSELAAVTSIAGGGSHSLAYSPPAPTVTSIEPKEGPQAGGTPVAITGREFTGATAVKFGSLNATTFTVNSDSSISAVSPAGTGAVDVTVTSLGGTSATSPADRFSYVHLPSEDLPELGRCVKVAGAGAYELGNCVLTSAAHKGSYEWAPGPGAQRAFSAKAGQVILETVGSARVSCGSGEVAGEWTGAKTASVSLVFKGCKNLASNKACQTSPSHAAEITTTQALEGELGFISGKGAARPKVGLDVKPVSPSPSLLSFTCGGPPEEVGAGESWMLEGSVIGEIKPIDRMKLIYKLLYKASAGKQSPERFEAGLKDTLLASRIVGVETKAEQAALTLRGERATIPAENKEKLEIKAKV